MDWTGQWDVPLTFFPEIENNTSLDEIDVPLHTQQNEGRQVQYSGHKGKPFQTKIMSKYIRILALAVGKV